jgi:hypothetical protein
LVISTALPSIDVDLSRAVQFYDGGAAELAAALAEAPQRYADNRAEIGRVRAAVCSRYSEEAVLCDLGAAIASLSTASMPLRTDVLRAKAEWPARF